MKFGKKAKIVSKIKKYIKAKMKLYNGKINVNFHINKRHTEDSECIFLSAILINSAFRRGKHYHSQVFLEECK